MHNNHDFFSFYVGKWYKILFVVFSLLLMWYIKHLTDAINEVTAQYEASYTQAYHQLK